MLWTDLVFSPALWGAVGGLVGVVLTALAKRGDQTLEAVKVLVGRLEHEVDSLNQRVSTLEAERESLGQRLRAALDWAHRVWLWGHTVRGLVPDGVDVPPAPSVPRSLEEEF